MHTYIHHLMHVNKSMNNRQVMIMVSEKRLWNQTDYWHCHSAVLSVTVVSFASIATYMLHNRLKNSSLFCPISSNARTNHDLLTHLPLLHLRHIHLHVLVIQVLVTSRYTSIMCDCLVWLARVIALVLVQWHSTENCSIYRTSHLVKSSKKFISIFRTSCKSRNWFEKLKLISLMFFQGK